VPTAEAAGSFLGLSAALQFVIIEVDEAGFEGPGLFLLRRPLSTTNSGYGYYVMKRRPPVSAKRFVRKLAKFPISLFASLWSTEQRSMVDIFGI